MRVFPLAALSILLLSCSFDDSAPGVRSQCASASADPLCQQAGIDSPDAACWRLVECGAIPVRNAEGEEDSYFDYNLCVRFFERLDRHRLDLSLACVGQATCDELRFEGSPNHPRRNINGFPICLAYGDQP